LQDFLMQKAKANITIAKCQQSFQYIIIFERVPSIDLVALL